MPTDDFTTREEGFMGGRVARPTAMPSRGIRESWDERIKREAVFSARTTSKAYLDYVKKKLVEVIGESTIVTPQEAERQLKEVLRNLGYTPEGGFGPDGVPPARAGAMTDLSSSRRIQLIIDTNVKRARSMGQVAASENPLTLMSLPAWKLTRTGARKKPRGNWKKRWAAAGASVGWKGAVRKAMVALKTSPIWAALGKGVGGFEDAIGSEYPPFAFGSGMAWVNVGRKEWKQLCAAEGVPDGLDEVTAKAKELKASQETGRGAPVTSPAGERMRMRVGGTGAEAAGRPVGGSVAARGRTGAVPTAGTDPIGGLFTANFKSRNEANDNIDEAMDAITAARDGVRKIVGEMADLRTECGKLAGPLPKGERRKLLTFITNYRTAVGKAAGEIDALMGRVTTYGGAVETEPVPRNAEEQGVFDTKMRRYGSSAVLAAKEAAAQFRKAGMNVMAARTVAERMRGLEPESEFTADLKSRMFAEKMIAKAESELAKAASLPAEMRLAVAKRRTEMAAEADKWPDADMAAAEAKILSADGTVAEFERSVREAAEAVAKIRARVADLAEPTDEKTQDAFDGAMTDAAREADDAGWVAVSFGMGRLTEMLDEAAAAMDEAIAAGIGRKAEEEIKAAEKTAAEAAARAEKASEDAKGFVQGVKSAGAAKPETDVAAALEEATKAADAARASAEAASGAIAEVRKALAGVAERPHGGGKGKWKEYADAAEGLVRTAKEAAEKAERSAADAEAGRDTAEKAKSKAEEKAARHKECHGLWVKAQADFEGINSAFAAVSAEANAIKSAMSELTKEGASGTVADAWTALGKAKISMGSTRSTAKGVAGGLEALANEIFDTEKAKELSGEMAKLAARAAKQKEKCTALAAAARSAIQEAKGTAAADGSATGIGDFTEEELSSAWSDGVDTGGYGKEKKVALGGGQFTMKPSSSTSAEHLESSVKADALYAAAGAKTPKSKMASVGGTAFKVAEAQDAGKSLDQALNGKGKDKAKVMAGMEKCLAASVMTSNWDVASNPGALKVDADGNVVVPETLGALGFRVRGARKPAENWSGGWKELGDLFTMREGTAAQYFGTVSTEALVNRVCAVDWAAACKAAFGGLSHPDAKVIMARAEKFRKLREEIARAKKEGMDIDEAVRYMIEHDGKQMPKDDIGENGAKFTEADHTKERQDKAVWDKSPNRGQLADEVLRDDTGKVWKQATQGEKDSAFLYTHKYKFMNEPLRGQIYYGKPPRDTKQTIDELTQIIGKSPIPKDMWFQRGTDIGEFVTFGIKKFPRTQAEANKLVGKEGVLPAFTSMAVAKGKGFDENPIIMNIYCPAGSKALYAEPFSHYGNHKTDGKWNGETKQKTYSKEDEAIMQRGSRLRIIKAEISGGKLYVDLVLLSQKPLPFPYKGDYPYPR